MEAAARDLFKDRVRELDNLAFELNDSLDGIAQTLSLDVKTVEGVTRASGAGIFVNAQLRDALFEADVLLDGNNTSAVEYADGQAAVARIAKLHPAALQPFDEVSESIEELLTGQAARDALLLARNEALQQVRDGASVTAVADGHGLAWETFELALRDRGSAPETVLSAAFALPRPADGERSVGEAGLGDEGAALVTVTRVVDGELGTLSDAELDTLREYFASRNGNLEFASLQTALDSSADIERP